MNRYLAAIDPGTEQSAAVCLDPDGNLSRFGIYSNQELLHIIGCFREYEMVIEKVASYGMPVGAEVFETVFWSGRFFQVFTEANYRSPAMITRGEVKMHFCHTMKGVNDAVIRQALIDRYGPGKDKAIGTKKTMGPLYGITKDCWAALALAVTHYDRLKGVGCDLLKCGHGGH